MRGTVLLMASFALGACAGRPEGAGSTPAPREEGHSATAGEFGDQGATQVEQLMDGRFPGVRILPTSQGGFVVQVRGATSLSGPNGPLYVIDGTPVQVGPAGLTGLNPADIEKIRVLTDVASTSFYGVRGANGVVVITTKRPK